MLGQAFSLYRRHFGTLVLTCALVLGPANLLAAGAVRFGLARLGAGGVAEARTHTQEVHDQKRDLAERPPATPEAREVRVRQLGRDAVEGEAGFDATGFLRTLIPFAYATVIIAALLLAGLFLAHAAVVPLVLQPGSGPGQAWAAVGSRLGPLLMTGVFGAAIVAVASLFFVLPGLALAAGFSFAAPAAMLEGLWGRAALERSWTLMRGHWAPVVGMWMLIVVFSIAASLAAAAVPEGAWRPLVSAGVRMVTYPLPLVGLVLAYEKARKTRPSA